MKTKYKYIEFEFQPISECWVITSWIYEEPVGQLNYYPNQWIFSPYENTDWTMDSLADIIDFVKQLNQEVNNE